MSKIDALPKIVKATCAVYGAGLTKSGALATRNLVLMPTMTTSMLRPIRISRLNNKKIRKIAAGLGFSLFASQNELYGSGLNNFSQLAGSSNPTPSNENPDDYYIIPRKIPLPDNPTIINVAAGRLHSLIGTTNGVYAFGDNHHGQCAQDPNEYPIVSKMEDDSILRVSIPSDSLCRQVHCSLDTSFALLENGELYSWGLSTDGQLGTGCSDIDWRPTRVPIDEPLKMIAGTGDTIMALTHTGKVYVWGQAEYNQMSEFTDDPQIFYPMQVDFDFDGAGVKSVAATNTSCIIATTDGKVFTWGSMFLGAGPKVNESSRPLHLSSNLFSDSNGRYGRVRRVIAGISSVGAINEADNLFIWGANRYGNLALGHDKDQLFPYQVFLPFSVKKLSLGPVHSLILTDTI